MKRVFITGASGRIGKYVSKILKFNGYYTVGNYSRHCIDYCDENFSCDITNDQYKEIVSNNVQKCDVIIHLASDISIPYSNNTIDVNCKGMKNIIELANYWEVDTFIYFSSVPVIGTPKKDIVDEDHEINPVSLYHITKYCGEMMMKSMLNADIRQIVCRIPSPIGKGLVSRFVSSVIESARKNDAIEIYGTGSRTQNYVDVRDIAEAVLLIIQSQARGVFIISGAREISNLELAKLCKEIIKSDSEIVIGSHPDVEENVRWNLTYAKASKEFGYCPRHSIEDTIKWITEE